ncbi:hypothetical protein [Streptomyces sp. MUM 2J]|uniref:hypothetical protein n=1 Tax=Streptomyces sp. MUM 2J TaxID=2791987 RepID=UPI001F03C4D9|nr:hypothetical protein [Streptomyces sp. MUM 2J]MCH0567050.1 hypothetical protein [Streptomyces sp. MUM 2J]
MKIFASRRSRVAWALGSVLSALGIAAFVLYSTGAYASWRDQRSLDSACDGTLAQGGLDAALNSSHQRARADDPDYLASCLVNRPDTGRHGGALTIRLRWSNQSATLATLAPLGQNANGVKGQAAPLGSGWPGVIRYDGTAQVVVALECQNAKDKALLAYGDLIRWPEDAKETGPVLTGLGRVTTETAQKAAAKYGCRAKGGTRLTHVSPPVPARDMVPQSLSTARGSCAALVGLAGRAAEAGTPDAVEYPADRDTPQVNCYLFTPDRKPGYGLYAYYGALAKDFQSSGFTEHADDYVWATAQCPGSAQDAVFVLYRLYDRETGSYPVAHYSGRFARSALKAFADHEAKLRGCTGVHVVSRP